MWTYLLDDPAIILLGRVKSSNLLALKPVNLGKTDTEDVQDLEPLQTRDKGKGKVVSFVEEEPEVTASGHSNTGSDGSIGIGIEPRNLIKREEVEKSMSGDIDTHQNFFSPGSLIGNYFAGARINVPIAKDVKDLSGRVQIQTKGTKTQLVQAKKLLEEKKTAFD